MPRPEDPAEVAARPDSGALVTDHDGCPVALRTHGGCPAGYRHPRPVSGRHRRRAGYASLLCPDHGLRSPFEARMPVSPPAD